MFKFVCSGDQLIITMLILKLRYKAAIIDPHSMTRMLMLADALEYLVAPHSLH